MDTQKVNGVSPKENGSHRGPPSYSVETPYGFHLDLDFVKYVEDIEKGNTIRRVPIQRRPRGRSSGNLSRNLSLPGYVCRSSQWNSTSTLFPRSQLADSHQPYEFQSSDSESAGFTRQSEPTYKTFTAQVKTTIQAFDEQPLGPRVRPNLLRASSLPLTVLLRKYSESTEDPTSPNGSRDYFAQENGSSEDVFHSPERNAGRVNGTIQQLTAALQRVGELEEMIRIIPELKAQICILQEERERLLHTFQSETDNTLPLDFPSGIPQTSKNSDAPTQISETLENQNKANDDWMDREYDQLEENVKASSEQVHAIVIPLTTEKDSQATRIIRDTRVLLDHEDKDKSLVETLQKKTATLEQKLHELESDLEKTRGLLKEQVQESSVKDERINELTKHAANIWVKPEGTTVHPDNVRNASDLEPSPERTSENTQKLKPSVQMSSLKSTRDSQECLEEEFKPCASRGPAGPHADMEHHVKKVKELLQEQWEYLCRKEESGKVLSSEHLPPRIFSIQEQLVSLVNLLTLYISPTGHAPPSAQESMMEDQISVLNKSTWERLTQDNAGDRMSSEGKYVVESSIRPEELVEEGFDQKISQIEAITTRNQTLIRETTHCKVAMRKEHHEQQIGEVKCPDDKAVKEEDKQDRTRLEAKSEEPSQREGSRGPKTDFMSACYFLENHMDEVSEPNNEMREALTVVFQQWFHVSAEEDSCADTLALYLSEVATKTPAVLQFLVNMVDDNGNTALHYSVSHFNFSIVKLLLDTGVCEVDLKNKIGYTAIMLASLLPVDTDMDMKVVQQLMELSDVNARAGQVGQTALHLAVRHGRASMMRLLLAHGANVNAQDQAGTTALISACDRGHTDIVRILLEAPDCDVNLTDKGGRSALSLATQASHTEIADLLKARTNTKGHDKCKMA